MKKSFWKCHREQAGQGLILVLILLVLGSLVLVPSLALSITALRSGERYEGKTNELYTADAGIEDGVWRIKYEFFGPDYDPYDFDTEYEYETETLNGITANVTIQNVWLPSNATLASLNLTAADARAIIDSERLVVSGSAGAIPGEPYDIKIDYDPVDVSENLTVKSIGVWLPAGFAYDPDDPDTLWSLDPFDDAYAEPDITTVPGGTSIVWDYDFPYPRFIEFPGVNTEDDPMSMEISFSYDVTGDNPDAMPTAIAWIITELESGADSDYPISWDVDTRFFKITSASGDTSIQAYSSRTELRQLGDALLGDYVAIGDSLMKGDPTRRDEWIDYSTTAVTTVPEDADAILAYLYWTGWRDASHIVTILEDDCTDITANWTRAASSDWSDGSGYYAGVNSGGGAAADYLTFNTLDLSSYVPGSIMITWEQDSEEAELYLDTADDVSGWTAGDAWSASSGEFVGNDNPGGEDALLTMNSPVDLSALTGNTVTVSWEQDESGRLEEEDVLYYAFSSDNGTNWSDNEIAFYNDDPSSPKTVVIPQGYLTSQFKMRFEIVGFTGDENCYIDDVRIAAPLTAFDGLDFAVSGDGGVNWSESIEAFRDDVTSSTDSYEYYLPAAYTTDQFTLRFDTVGLTGGQEVRLDDICFYSLTPDNSVEFFIGDGEETVQVYLNSSGEPEVGESDLVAPSASVIRTTSLADGLSYACKVDVSKIIKKYPIDEEEEHHTGNAIYTVGQVEADTGTYLSHAGWSLIIIYASPSTVGHFLYLRDYFVYQPGSNNDLDFDGDGVGGGTVTDFVIPEPIRGPGGEITNPIAARITCFIGEGDGSMSGDSLEIVGQQSEIHHYLSNTASPWNNVWNGASPDMTNPGIDVDTFTILWEEGILQPGDTNLELHMQSWEAWNFIYLILSVRSETLTSGTTHYVINME